jgi:hypothetical protein
VETVYTSILKELGDMLSNYLKFDPIREVFFPGEFRLLYMKWHPQGIAHSSMQVRAVSDMLPVGDRPGVIRILASSFCSGKGLEMTYRNLNALRISMRFL